MAQTILEITNKPQSLISFIPDRMVNDRRYAINDSKIEKELGFVRKWNLKEGLEYTVNWYKNNENWWKPLC